MTARSLDADTLRRTLPDCLDVPRFVDEVVAGAPYDSIDELLDAASDAAADLDDAELERALSHHPRIGERPTGDSTTAALSAAEQRALDADDAALAERIAEGNRAYEARFGRVFLIRAAGRTRAEVAAELDRRLQLDDDAAERVQTVAELRDIALTRIRTLFADPDAAAGPGDPTPTSR